MNARLSLIASGVVAAVIAATPAPAEAFCGFYIDGAGKSMYNEATQVVLMRKGTRTVLSMRNTYRGPVKDFAMVVPVPVVLAETDVKILPDDVFDRVDTMGSPRLVEYWEQDPCAPPDHDEDDTITTTKKGGKGRSSGSGKGGDLGVTVEAQFDVGEYQVVILSATESTGLETWLTESGYKIPAKSEKALRPYVEAGSKFFVAKVDPDKVKFEGKRALLSPLRFHYDTDDFVLPIRLGLVNSSGTQDLIINILAPNQRYQVANYKNVTIPTNIEVKDEVRKKFAEFYAALFDRTAEKNPGAVITEYSWDAGSCDPCPGPVLSGGDLATLGGDVIEGGSTAGTGKGRSGSSGFVLTRLHARYGTKDMKDDLVFEAATAIAGGREHLQEGGKLEEGSREAHTNNFQGRYIIRHRWTGKIACSNPVRNIWGGPTDRSQIAADVKPARNLAFAPRGKMKLNKVIKQNIPEIGVKMKKKVKKKKAKPKAATVVPAKP